MPLLIQNLEFTLSFINKEKKLISLEIERIGVYVLGMENCRSFDISNKLRMLKIP